MGKKKVAIIYKPGDLVFAKVKGYPYWPARIEEDNLPKGKYKVFFYGTHETYNCKVELILPFEENKEKLGKEKKARGFNDGMWEIQNEPNLVIASQNLDQNNDSNSNQTEIESRGETDSHDAESNVSLEQQQQQQDRRKSIDSTASSIIVNKKKSNNDNSTIKKSKSTKRRRNHTQSVEDNELVHENEQINKKQKIDNEKNLNNQQQDNNNLSNESKEIKDDNSKLLIDSQLSVNSATSSTIPAATTTAALTAGELRKKIMEESKMRWFKMSPDEREEEKMKLKRKKLEEKKREKLKSIRIQLALLRMDREIKKSLQVDNTDEERCCLIMEDLLKLPFQQKHLFKAPEIVETIKKCRKYKNSELVRKNASECFYKFQYMFDIPPGETFWSVFGKEREKYLAENVEELKKERNFANKLQLEIGAASSTSDKQKTTISERTRSVSLSSTTSNSILNALNHNICNIESPLSSTTSSINHSPLSASSNHSTNNS